MSPNLTNLHLQLKMVGYTFKDHPIPLLRSCASLIRLASYFYGASPVRPLD